MEQAIHILLSALGIYLAIGLVFAVAFVTKGAAAIDPSAKEGTWGFKVLIFPASAALWPLMAKRWFGGQTEPPEECSPHRCAACGKCDDKGGAS